MAFDDGDSEDELFTDLQGTSEHSRRYRNRDAKCQVPGCKQPLSQKIYYKRYRICGHHSQLPNLVINGAQKRWCQQCGRFQLLEDFDGDRKTCRAKLSKHNSRRKNARTQGRTPGAEDGQPSACSTFSQSSGPSSANLAQPMRGLTEGADPAPAPAPASQQQAAASVGSSPLKQPRKPHPALPPQPPPALAGPGTRRRRSPAALQQAAGPGELRQGHQLQGSRSVSSPVEQQQQQQPLSQPLQLPVAVKTEPQAMLAPTSPLSREPPTEPPPSLEGEEPSLAPMLSHAGSTAVEQQGGELTPPPGMRVVKSIDLRHLFSAQGPPHAAPPPHRAPHPSASAPPGAAAPGLLPLSSPRGWSGEPQPSSSNLEDLLKGLAGDADGQPAGSPSPWMPYYSSFMWSSGGMEGCAALLQQHHQQQQQQQAGEGAGGSTAPAPASGLCRTISPAMASPSRPLHGPIYLQHPAPHCQQAPPADLPAAVAGMGQASPGAAHGANAARRLPFLQPLPLGPSAAEQQCWSGNGSGGGGGGGGAALVPGSRDPSDLLLHSLEMGGWEAMQAGWGARA